MRQWNRVLAVATALAAGAACATGGKGAPGPAYTPRDRQAMAVLFPRNGGCAVIGGPETHIAFAGKKVTWRVINLCPEDAELEIQFLERSPKTAPENPFVEDLGKTPLHARRGTEPGNGFQLTIRESKAFAPRVVNEYKYRLQIKGRPDSGIDPELEIWP